MRNEPCGRDIVIPYILYFILNFRMKRFRFCLVAGMLLFISVSTVAKGVPTSIQAAFEKMYPYVANAQWEQMAGCYVAEFVIDGRETDVWFDENAQWVMMENDVESLEKVPAPVAEAFMESIMASMRLRALPITWIRECWKSILRGRKMHLLREVTRQFRWQGKTGTYMRCGGLLMTESRESLREALPEVKEWLR